MFGSLIPATQLALWAAAPWPEVPRACGVSEGGVPTHGNPLTEDTIHRAVKAIESGIMDDLLVAGCRQRQQGAGQATGQPGQPARGHMMTTGAPPPMHDAVLQEGKTLEPTAMQPLLTQLPQSQPQQQLRAAGAPATRSSEGSDATLTPATSTGPSMDDHKNEESSRPKRRRTGDVREQAADARGQQPPRAASPSGSVGDLPWTGKGGRRRSSGRPSLHDLAAAALALAGEAFGGLGDAAAASGAPGLASMKSELQAPSLPGSQSGGLPVLMQQQHLHVHHLHLQQHHRQVLGLQLQEEQQEQTETEGPSSGGGSLVRKRKARTIPLQEAASTVTLERLCSLFVLPIEEARAQVCMSKNSFRKLLSSYGYKRWPQRQLTGLNNLLEYTKTDPSLTEYMRKEYMLRIQANVKSIMEGTEQEVYEDLQKLSHVYHNRKYQQLNNGRRLPGPPSTSGASTPPSGHVIPPSEAVSSNGVLAAAAVAAAAAAAAAVAPRVPAPAGALAPTIVSLPPALATAAAPGVNLAPALATVLSMAATTPTAPSAPSAPHAAPLAPCQT